MKKIFTSIKYLIPILTFVSCSWNVDDYEDVSKEVESKVADLDSYWQKKKNSIKTQKIGHGWGKKTSDKLINLVNRGLVNSPTVEAIYHKIALVQGQRELIDSTRFPRFDLTLGINSQILGGLDGLGIGPTLNWEIDLFSKIANAVESADQEVLASEYMYKQAREFLAGLIAKTWVIVSNRKKLLEVTEKQYELNKEIYKNVSARYKVGSSPLTT